MYIKSTKRSPQKFAGPDLPKEDIRWGILKHPIPPVPDHLWGKTMNFGVSPNLTRRKRRAWWSLGVPCPSPASTIINRSITSHTATTSRPIQPITRDRLPLLVSFQESFGHLPCKGRTNGWWVLWVHGTKVTEANTVLPKQHLGEATWCNYVHSNLLWWSHFCDFRRNSEKIKEAEKGAPWRPIMVTGWSTVSIIDQLVWNPNLWSW